MTSEFAPTKHNNQTKWNPVIQCCNHDPLPSSLILLTLYERVWFRPCHSLHKLVVRSSKYIKAIPVKATGNIAKVIVKVEIC